MKRILGLFLLLLTPYAQAGLVSGNDIIAAVSLRANSVENTQQQAFDEKQSVVLTRDIMVDGGLIISEGTKVDSQIIFLNTPGNVFKRDTQRWGFDGQVLGVMSDFRAELLNGNNDLFASFDDYFADIGGWPSNALGLETEYHDAYTIDGSFLDLTMNVKQRGDWIRVITLSAVPIPASIWLFGTGLLGFVGMRKKNALSAVR